MAAVFNADTGKPLVVKAGKAIVKCGSVTLIALDVSLTYQRSVEVIPTIGTKQVMSIGKPQGTFTASTILSKEANADSGLHINDDGCKPYSITITFQDGGCSMDGQTVTAHNCVTSALSISAQGARGFVAQGVQVVFTALTK